MYIYIQCALLCVKLRPYVYVYVQVYIHTQLNTHMLICIPTTHAYMYSYLYIQHICTIHLYKKTFEHTFTYTHKLTPSKSFTFPCPKKICSPPPVWRRNEHIKPRGQPRYCRGVGRPRIFPAAGRRYCEY